MKCPYYERINEAMARRGVQGYCAAYPSQGIMIPSMIGERKYCWKASGYLRCPVYCSMQTIGLGGEAEQRDLCFPLL